MEASALQAPAGLTRSRISIGLPLLRLRSDEQLVALFRAGNEDAFRVIHDRYRQRLFAYTRQMMPGSRQDAEDALQEVFVRAYSGLRASDRELALRAWLYRVAHNRCIDELRRPPPPAPDVFELVRAPTQDPIAQAEQRESLRRLIADVRRLPEHQRSALLMRELSGMSYAELAGALGVSVQAVKSLLVRARVSLARAQEARDTACSEIRDELVLARDRRVRPNAVTRRHLRDCAGCREFRQEVRGINRQLAALVPGLGPMAVLAKFLGIGGGASGGAAAGSGAAGGAACAGSAASTGIVAGSLACGAGHVATLLAAAVVTAGGAVEIQRTFDAPAKSQSSSHIAGRTSAEPPTASLTAVSSRAAGASPASDAGSSSNLGHTAPATAAAKPGPVSATQAISATGAGSPGAGGSSSALTGSAGTGPSTAAPGGSSPGAGGTSTAIPAAGAGTPGATPAATAPGTTPGTSTPGAPAAAGAGSSPGGAKGSDGSPSGSPASAPAAVAVGTLIDAAGGPSAGGTRTPGS